jgi:futalosine hydrolase
MKRLIVSATSLELNGIVSLPEKTAPGTIISSEGADFLVTGIGQAIMAYHMGRILGEHSYDEVINIGICGSFHSELRPGTVVTVMSDCFADLGAEDDESWLDIFSLGLAEADQKPFTNGVLIADGIRAFNHLQKVKGITVNRASGNEATIDKMRKYYDADVETMEGAAFYYACLSKNIPCIQVRAVSNFIEKRNRENWDIKTALDNLHAELKKYYL